jgi:hypothetical protein
VTIFTETAIQTKQEVQLTQGGMLLMALLGGGDYDTVRIASMLLLQGLLFSFLLGWPLRLWGNDRI